jgi:predicted RNase H-like HicB family nuclease
MPHDLDTQLQQLLAMPWTIVSEMTPEGDRLLRVREIPSAIGTGETDEEIERDLMESLEASLRAYLHFGDAVPLPNGMARETSPLATS